MECLPLKEDPNWQCCPGLACVGSVEGKPGVCEPAECALDKNCPEDKPFCGEGSCVVQIECIDDAQCENACDVETNTCLPPPPECWAAPCVTSEECCSDDYQCNFYGNCVDDRCKPETMECLPLKDDPNWQCCPGLACVGSVDGKPGVCEPAECAVNENCSEDKPFCEEGVCVQCIDDAQCDNACDVETNTCLSPPPGTLETSECWAAPCATSEECCSDDYQCNFYGNCVDDRCKLETMECLPLKEDPNWQCCPGLACVGSVEGKPGVCEPAECAVNEDCPEDKPFCEEGLCVQCIDDAQCDNACDVETKTCLPPPPPACEEECITLCDDGVEIIGICKNGEC